MKSGFFVYIIDMGSKFVHRHRKMSAAMCERKHLVMKKAISLIIAFVLLVSAALIIANANEGEGQGEPLVLVTYNCDTGEEETVTYYGSAGSARTTETVSAPYQGE